MVCGYVAVRFCANHTAYLAQGDHDLLVERFVNVVSGYFVGLALYLVVDSQLFQPELDHRRLLFRGGEVRVLQIRSALSEKLPVDVPPRLIPFGQLVYILWCRNMLVGIVCAIYVAVHKQVWRYPQRDREWWCGGGHDGIVDHVPTGVGLTDLVQHYLYVCHCFPLSEQRKKSTIFHIMVVQETVQNKSEFTTVGVDQALKNVGLCVNKNGSLSGMLVREMKLRGAARLDSLENQITMYAKVFHPDLIAMEGYSFGSINRPFDLGEIGGILKLSFRRLGIPLIIVAPSLLKQFVTGDGSASKARMMGYVNTRYSYDTDNDNIADAVGLAKFAEVYLTGKSSYRSELDAVLSLREALVTKKVSVRFKKLPSI